MLKKFILYPLETALVYIFFYILKAMPVDWASTIGGRIMRLIGPHLKVTKTVAHPNISLAMPELSEDQKNSLIQDMWENLGRVIGEFPHLMDICDDATRVSFKGIDYVLNHTNKPLIMTSGHLGNWELLPVMTSSYHLKSTMIYRPPNNPYVDSLLRKARHVGEDLNLVNKGPKGARELIKTLKNKGVVAMLVDQKLDTGVKIKFLGTDAMTASAPAEFAIKYKADLLFIRTVRTKGAYFKIEALPPFDILNFLKEHEAKTQKEQVLILTQLMHDQIGEWVTENPSQWLWSHRRWTSRPGKE